MSARLRRAIPGAIAMGVAVAALAGPRPARAQDAPPFDPAIDLQLFEYAIGPRSFLTVNDGDTLTPDRLTVDFTFTALTSPFTVFDVDPERDEIAGVRSEVVQALVAGDLSAAYGLADGWQLGVSLPVVFSISGQGLDPVDAMPSPDGLQATGLGDARVELQRRLWRSDAISVSAIGGVTLPTSVGAGGSAFLGDDLPSARARLAARWTSAEGRLAVGSAVGVIARKPRALYANTVGQQLTYAAAAAARLNDRVSAVAELFGRAGLPAPAVESSPLEASGGLRVQATRAVSVLAGGGAGLVQGIGAPGLRVFVSVGWAPDYGDADGDGVRNTRDRCPDLAEDADGWEDADGCPEADNDGDLREDGVDQCPNEREDIDGFADDDGCPDPDNDGDGIEDVRDPCPVEAEDGVGLFADDGCPASKTDADGDGVMDDRDQCGDAPEDMDGFEDWDGCPDPDNDGDGLADDADACPLCAEDIDGFADDDGCPDPDNDGDGIADAADACPGEPETINGVRDADGCPDAGRALAALDGDRIALSRQLRFGRRDEVRRRSVAMLDQVAGLMLQRRDVTQWLIVVAARRQRTDEATRDRSQRQADAIRAYLMSRGVPAEVLEAVGAVSDRPQVGIVIRERQEATDPEAVCPAQRRVVPRQPPADGGAGGAGDASDAGSPAGASDASDAER